MFVYARIHVNIFARSNLMKSVIKRFIESVVLIAVSAALWQIALLPVADTINKKLPLSMVQNLTVVLILGIVVILINIYSKNQGYLNWGK